MKFFVPFARLRQQPTIVVDSTANGAALVLAHWRGAPTPAALRDDTSAGSVLRALHAPATPGLEASAVTANHFDIDGFIGVWSLLHPAQALRHERLLRLTATLGDFRELDRSDPLADAALQLVGWLNAKEQELFYRPFGAPALRRREDEASAEKFAWFLPSFGAVLENPETGRAAWEPEYRRVKQATAVMASAHTRIRRYPEIGLVVIETPEPLPYYALFGPTAGFDMVLSLYSGNRYEFEYKYTTWIDLESQPTLPRLPLAALAARLNALETTPRRWTHDGITDTGPLLRLEGSGLAKAQRYADPDQRPIYASSISPEKLEQEVVAFFQAGYAAIEPRRYWSWADIRAAGEQLVD
ncbi:hypothetical protein SAMN02745146_0137 [Hymenobacter daecheongensis DSM 21074]|uniref:Uncharacterized protein n=1 Tax=Hymenobacter daecheongensis DSM 21074 TaxID=1121955 RepID=A0A1M6M1A9_9BACT|nr:DUF6687 family protein [Hymenobacter daecheongensis]SHJ77269.1 hypothetical protein SAMN02745146_0137 [Hymenobacter daecheongensis DSM 21074]